MGRNHFQREDYFGCARNCNCSKKLVSENYGFDSENPLVEFQQFEDPSHSRVRQNDLHYPLMPVNVQFSDQDYSFLPSDSTCSESGMQFHPFPFSNLLCDSSAKVCGPGSNEPNKLNQQAPLGSCTLGIVNEPIDFVSTPTISYNHDLELKRTKLFVTVGQTNRLFDINNVMNGSEFSLKPYQTNSFDSVNQEIFGSESFIFEQDGKLEKFHMKNNNLSYKQINEVDVNNFDFHHDDDHDNFNTIPYMDHDMDLFQLIKQQIHEPIEGSIINETVPRESFTRTVPNQISLAEPVPYRTDQFFTSQPNFETSFPEPASKKPKLSYDQPNETGSVQNPLTQAPIEFITNSAGNERRVSSLISLPGESHRHENFIADIDRGYSQARGDETYVPSTNLNNFDPLLWTCTIELLKEICRADVEVNLDKYSYPKSFNQNNLHSSNEGNFDKVNLMQEEGTLSPDTFDFDSYVSNIKGKLDKFSERKKEREVEFSEDKAPVSPLPVAVSLKRSLKEMKIAVSLRYWQYRLELSKVERFIWETVGHGGIFLYTTSPKKAMSSCFCRVKDAIRFQLKIWNAENEPVNFFHFQKNNDSENCVHENGLMDGKGIYGSQNGLLTCEITYPNHLQRLQRGLPEKSIAILRAWLFEHFLNPYPTDEEKDWLAQASGLQRNQVTNWFINARVRLWKPMIESMYEEACAQTKPDASVCNLSSDSNEHISEIGVHSFQSSFALTPSDEIKTA